MTHGGLPSRDLLNEISSELRDFIRLVKNPKVVLGSLLILCSECSGGYFGSGTGVEGLKVVDVARKLYNVTGRSGRRLSGSYLNQVSLALKDLADRGLVKVVSSEGRAKYVVSTYGMLVCSLLELLGFYHTRRFRGHAVSLIKMPGISEAFSMERVRTDIKHLLSKISENLRENIVNPRAVPLLLLKLINESGGSIEGIYRAIGEARESGEDNFLDSLPNTLIKEIKDVTEPKQGSEYIIEATEEQLLYYLANRISIPLRHLASHSGSGVAYARVSDLAITQYFYLVKTFFDKDHPIPSTYRRKFAVHFLDLGSFTIPLRFNPSEGEGVKAAYIRSDLENLVIHYLESIEKAVLISINFPPTVIKEYLGDNVFDGVRRFVESTALIPNEGVDENLFKAFLNIGGYVIPDIYQLVKEFNSTVRFVFWKSFLGINADLNTSLLSSVLKLERNTEIRRNGDREELGQSKRKLDLNLEITEKADKVLMSLIAERLGLSGWGKDDIKSIVEIVPIGTQYLSEIQSYSQKLVPMLKELLRRTENELRRLEKLRKKLEKKTGTPRESTKKKRIIVKCDTETLLLSREALLRTLAILTFIAGIFTKDPAPEPLGKVLKSIDVSSLGEVAYTTDREGLTRILTQLIEKIEDKQRKRSKTLVLTEGVILSILYSRILRNLLRSNNTEGEDKRIKLEYSYAEKLFFTNYGEALAIARLRDIIVSSKLHRIKHIKSVLQKKENSGHGKQQDLLEKLEELKEEVMTPLKTTLGTLSNVVNTFTTLNRVLMKPNIKLRKIKYSDENAVREENLSEVLNDALRRIASMNLSMVLENYEVLLGKLRSALEDLIDVLEYIGSPEGEGVYRIRAVINFYSYPTINSVIGGILDKNLADIASIVSG